MPELHLPNILTLSRLALAPVFVWFFIQSHTHPSARWAAAIVFLAASLTDLVDGYLARRRNQVTPFGAIADPIADKLLTGSALIGLSLEGTVAWWVTWVILGREALVTVVRLAVLRRGVIPASRGGKVKTVSQIVAIVAYLVPLGQLGADLGAATMVVALVLTLGTGVDYIARAIRLHRV